MTLTRISKIKDYRIFRDFQWPSDLHDFGRFNIIYGWNGAGKTTLSTLLSQVQLKQPVIDGNVELMFGDRTVNGAELDKVPVPNVRVFNRDFVDRAVFESAGKQLPPVYYFGENSVEKQRRIVELTEKRDTLGQIQRAKETASALASQNRDSYCTDQARGIRNLLTTSGGGPYNNYDARPFKVEVQRLAALETQPVRLTEVEREAHMRTRESRPLPFLPEVTVSFPDLVDLRKRAEAVLNTSVVSSVIDELTQDPAVALWVGQGLELHRGDHLTKTCRFCDQHLQADRVAQLESHFNDEFNKLKQKISGLIDEVDRATAFEASLAAPPKELLYEGLQGEYFAAMTDLLSQSKILKGSLETLRQALIAKQNDPFTNIELSSWLKQLGTGTGLGHFFIAMLAFAADGAPFFASFAGAKALRRLNVTIADHNRITGAFDTSVKSARNALAQDELLASVAGWIERSQTVTDADKERDIAHNSAVKLDNEIAELETEIRQHHLPAVELNSELAVYLGRSELKFLPAQNGYRIMRDDQLATHLSDGERTAIAFMYFLKSLQGTDFTLSDGIVVIDDPVSSLDANSLFSAFGFLKDRTAKAKQLIILTHNFAFFRQVRNWFDSVNKRSKPHSKQAFFYMLSPVVQNGRRGAQLGKLDSFLTDFESEYHYIFKRVYELTLLQQGQGLEQYYGIPNLARRLLETFLAYRIPGRSGDLYGKLNDVNGDVATKTRVLRFLHTFSHGDAVAHPEHDPSILSETHAVLCDVLELVRVNDQLHYDAMVKVVSAKG